MYKFLEWLKLETTDVRGFVELMRHKFANNPRPQEAVHENHPTRPQVTVYLANPELWPARRGQGHKEYWYMVSGAQFEIHVEIEGHGQTFEEADADYTKKMNEFFADTQKVTDYVKTQMKMYKRTLEDAVTTIVGYCGGNDKDRMDVLQRVRQATGIAGPANQSGTFTGTPSLAQPSAPSSVSTTW